MSKTKAPAEFDYAVRTRGQNSRPLNSQRFPRPAIAVNRAIEHKTTFGDSDEQLSKLLEAAEIVVWEADCENFDFNYVSEEAVRLAGYEIDEWYQPDFFASHIHPTIVNECWLFAGTLIGVISVTTLNFACWQRTSTLSGSAIWLR
jgi:hypothetical protein